MTTFITLRPAATLRDATVATIAVLDEYTLANFKMIMLPDHLKVEHARDEIEREVKRIVDAKATWEQKIKSIIHMRDEE